MVELRHASHCVYKIRYHLVLCVKYRKCLLSEQKRIEYLKTLCNEIAARYRFEFDTIGTDGDHLHIFVGAEPKYSPSRLIQIIKSITAREMFKPDLPIHKRKSYPLEKMRETYKSGHKYIIDCVCDPAGVSFPPINNT